MIQIRQETDIHASIEEVFAVLVDLRSYDRWLPPSQAFGGITKISSEPITLGTTYAEPGPNGVRWGTITEFDPPKRVTFHQPMTMKPSFLGIIDIQVSLTLTPTAASIQASRVVTLRLPWPLKLVRPFVVSQFRTESWRTLLALKTFAESPGEAHAPSSNLPAQ